MNSNYIKLAALIGAAAVAIGAFGAHGLESILEANQKIDTFETAVKYHFYHALAMLAISIWFRFEPTNKQLKFAIISFAIGILIFSGSLYILSLTGITWLGAITPLGGVSFIIGWIFIFIGAKNTAR